MQISHTYTFDYYPFGMIMPGRSYSSTAYKFGYQGSVKDNEIKGEGNSYAYQYRIYDSRLGRWLSIDPLQAKYPSMSVYMGMGNNPILFIDADGRVLQLIGDAGNIEKIRAHLQTEFADKIIVKVNEQGIVTLHTKDGGVVTKQYLKDNKMSRRQNKAYSTLNEIISNGKTTTAYVLSDADGKKALFGGWRSYKSTDGKINCNTIDYNDAKTFKEKTGGQFSTTGYILHELYETFQDQLKYQPKGENKYDEPHQSSWVMQGELDSITINPNSGSILDKNNNGFSYFFITNSKGERYTYKATIKALNIESVQKIDGWVAPKSEGGKDEMIKPKTDPK